MNHSVRHPAAGRPTHAWLRPIQVACVPGPTTPLLGKVEENLVQTFQALGHQVQETPDDQTDVILTTAAFSQPTSWREALLFTARRRFGLSRPPAIYTLMHARTDEFCGMIERFQQALTKQPPDLADYAFPGLAPHAYRVLYEQGNRGGPIMVLQRLLQAQSKSIHIILVVGDDEPLVAYLLDLVGASPRTEADDPAAFYADIVLRIVTTLSTREVNHHEVLDGLIPRAVWDSLSTPAAMLNAGKRAGERNFFTETLHIANMVQVPAIADVIASQYSEGCFGTWDPTLSALVATVTGSARPVDKGSLTEDDLAVIVGVRPDGSGAQVRHVEGKRNDPPSTESVEMMELDSALPTIQLGPEWDIAAPVPVVRSKLHGHRGIAAYDPNVVEYTPLDPPYYYYPVSCATEAQAQGIKQAFARSEALRNPDDPRQVVFTVLPGHGAVIAEKWIAGKVPFQMMWELMDAGALQVENRVPQGPMEFAPGANGRMYLSPTDPAPTDLPRRNRG